LRTQTPVAFMDLPSFCITETMKNGPILHYGNLSAQCISWAKEMMRLKYIPVAILLMCLGCQFSGLKPSMPVPEPSSATETNVVLKVGVAPDGMLKQQVVHAYTTRELKKHKLVVRAGASLDILESEGKASRVHFSTQAWTPDYKTEIPQTDASGWIATEDIVRIETKQEKPNKAIDGD
jgi:hypothetical protein